MSAPGNARLQALHALVDIIEHGHSLNTALPNALSQLNFRDAAFAQMLVYGVLRWRWRLEAVLSQLMQKPLKAKDLDIQLSLLIGLFQLSDTRVPDHAAVNASVELVRTLRKNWAANMVNAVLRNFIRNQQTLLDTADQDWQAKYAHPIWLIKQLRDDWPEHWPEILAANNVQGPLTLRINLQKTSAEQFLTQLDQPAAVQGDCITLEQASDVTRLPGYDDGWFVVQDGGAQLAAPLMELASGQRVLDACAAPGGKTVHMLALQPDIDLLALDISESRLNRVTENLQRLQLHATLVCADAAHREWWDGKVFDRILLDAPCTATGVIRRHPDIKSLRTADDIPELCQTQQQLLQNLWPMLAPGGLLLYVTCSVLKTENTQQIENFLATTADASEHIINADWGHTQQHGRQILPGENNMDGFYYALLRKAN